MLSLNFSTFQKPNHLLNRILYKILKPKFILYPDFTYSTLKKYLLGLVLLTYLMGTFHQGIFEFAHSLSHQFAGGHSYHSHHANDKDANHEHTTLDISKTAFEEHNDAPASSENGQQSSFDKIPQLCVSITFQAAIVELKNKRIPFFNLQLPPTPFLHITAPPPDFTA